MIDPHTTEVDMTKPKIKGNERPSRLISGIVELTGYSLRSVYNWIAAREVEYFRATNGSIRIYLDSLQPKHWAKVEKANKAAEAQAQKAN